MEYNFREHVEKLLEERRYTKKSLSEHLKMTSNGFDAMLKNNTVSAVKLAQIADFLKIPISHFYGEYGDKVKNNEEGNSFGDAIVKKMSKDIDELKHFFEEEIRTKNQQIAGLQESQKSLQRMLEVVLGKSEDDVNQPTLGYENAVAEAKRAYTKLGLSLVNAPNVFKTQIPLITE